MGVRLRLGLFILILLAGACKSFDIGTVMPKTENFSDYLARGYKVLSQYETFLAQDEDTALYFHTKAGLAAAREEVEPGWVEDKSLSAPAREELAAARQTLVNALADREKVGNIVNLAEAQVNFDCWLMRAAKSEASARLCRDTFYKVVASLELKEGEAPRLYSAYFGEGKATPDQEALSVIKQAAYAHALHEDWPVYLTGYSDPSGDKRSNQILSARRALAVRNALAQYGVDPDKVTIDAYGEEKSGASAGDAARARRVDIAIEPAYRHKNAGASHIEDIVPQYFD